MKHIPQNLRSKILLICDDIRDTSGIATMAREIITGTASYYNWIQIAVGHGDKKASLSDEINNILKINDSDVVLHPYPDYNCNHLLFQLIEEESPDAVMIFTDPRQWIWLFEKERELRQNIPLIYLNIWDNLPYPLYNKPYYESCDTLLAISKQTENINRVVLGENNKIIKYVPHGINENLFYPIKKEHPTFNELSNIKQRIFGNEEKDFVLFFNSRNIRRKSVGDVLIAFSKFLEELPPEKADRCAFILHTQIIDPHGTDLSKVIDICYEDNKNIFISSNKLKPEELNVLYNIADATILMSNAEGWGLSLTESLMAGTMIIGNVTGGIQDQMRFEDENKNWISFDKDFGSNHKGKYKTCGEWAIPVFPKVQTLSGTIPTPYIYDDICNIDDIKEAITKAYSMSKEEREYKGLKGHEWVISDESNMSAKNMCKNIVEGIDLTLKEFKPRSNFDFNKIKPSKNIKLNL